MHKLRHFLVFFIQTCRTYLQYLHLFYSIAVDVTFERRGREQGSVKERPFNYQ